MLLPLSLYAELLGGDEGGREMVKEVLRRLASGD